MYEIIGLPASLEGTIVFHQGKWFLYFYEPGQAVRWTEEAYTSPQEARSAVQKRMEEIGG